MEKAPTNPRHTFEYYNARKIMFGAMKELQNKRFIPRDKGILAQSGISLIVKSDTVASIRFNGQQIKYIQFLEEGTNPHDIPNAFGRPYPFGTYGRYDFSRHRHRKMSFSLFFHPGSIKHKDFISNKSLNFVVNYICEKYHANRGQ